MLLKEISSVSSGQGAPQSKEDYCESGITFIKASDLDAIIEDQNEDRASKITDEAFKRNKLCLFPKDTILFAKSGMSCLKNRVYVLKEASCVVNHLCCVSNVDERYDVNWIALFLKHYNVTRFIKDNAYPSISLKDVGSIVLPTIDKSLQKQIVESISIIQKAIDLKRKQLEDLDELVKSKFQEMFGDVDTNDKGFETVIGKDVFSFSSGKFLSAEKRKEEGIPVYGGNGISWFTDEALIDYPTIIIGRVGAYCGNVKMVNTPVWITDNAIFIKSFKKQVFNIRFLCQLMENASFDKYADVVAQPKITQKPLENYKYIVPDIELQERFADYVKSVDMARKTVGDELVDLGELMDSKMDEYFG